MPRALFVSAGGDHGAYALGMLYTMNAKYTHVCGISAGALIAAGLAHCDDTRECVQHMYETLRSSSIAEPWVAPKLGALVNAVYALLFRHSLFRNRIPTLSQPFMDAPLHKTLQVGAYNTTLGRYETFDDKSPLIASAVVASASPPGIFAPVKMGDYEYADGAMFHVIPVEEIRAYLERGEGDLDILMCYPISSLEEFMSCEMRKGFSLRKDVERATYEMVWNTMQRDLKELERMLGPLKSEMRVGSRVVRFVTPRKPVYSSFTYPSRQAVDAMYEAGKDSVRVELRL